MEVVKKQTSMAGAQMMIFRLALTSQLVISLLSCTAYAPAEETLASKKPISQTMSNPKNSPVDAGALVAALVNRNSAPKLRGDDRVIPVFDEKYDWSEYGRIWKRAIPDLATHAEGAWPDMMKNVDDKRYCITLGDDNGPYNWSVGEVCYTLIRLTLELPIASAAKPKTKSEWVRLKPDLLCEPEKLKSWWTTRRTKKLYELQIEMCELSIAQNSNNLAWVTALKAEIGLLRQSKQALLPAGFGDDYIVYSSKRAKKLREELNPRDQKK